MRFCSIYLSKLRNICYKTYFYALKFGGYQKKQYLCIVFFMVLDLRLSKDWVVVRQSSFFIKVNKKMVTLRSNHFSFILLNYYSAFSVANK